ncbi:MAG TPA: AroM family protein [Anaerolineae bacterium]|nr:AroM family protein [Anaerolineae bacterium]HIQ06227.1 AroM family protein [Anaerolineae bacterium]
MNKPRIGLVTIGQSPRDDIVPDLLPLWSGYELIQTGALDELVSREILCLAPVPGEDSGLFLVTRLRDGRHVSLAEKKLLPHLQTAIDRAVEQGVQLVVLLCTGSFPVLRCPVPFLALGQVLYHFVAAVVRPDTRLGILVPEVAQREAARQRWLQLLTDVRVVNLSPYQSDSEFEAELTAVNNLRECGLIVMDCAGYANRQRQRVRALLNRPVILPRTVLARVVQELIG